MNSTAIKLLELARHPNTSEHERGAAMNRFLALVSKAESVQHFLGVTSNDQAFVYRMYREATAQAEKAERERDDVAAERDLLLARLNAVRAASDADEPVVLLFGALHSEWRTAADLYRIAVENGFTGSLTTIRNRADKLANAGKIDTRPEHYDKKLDRYVGQSWRRVQS